MRHRLVLGSALLLTVVSCTPAVKEVISGFNVDIGGVDYKVIEKDSQWISMVPMIGDGHYYAKVSLAPSSPECIERIKLQMVKQNAKHLPISEKGLLPDPAFSDYLNDSTGVYIFDVFKRFEEEGMLSYGEPLSYRLLILDEEKKELIAFYFSL